MEETIVFNPEVDDRGLKQQSSKVQDSFSDATSNITPDVDLAGLGGGGGGLGGMGGGGGGGGGLMEKVGGVQDAIGGLGSKLGGKLPSSIAGVSASAAMPVAMAGAVGVGIAKSMANASARMGTSASMLKTAWDNVWRPIGDKVDQLFIRPIAEDLLKETTDFADYFRQGKFKKALSTLAMGATFDEQSLGENIGGVLGGAGGLLAGAKAGAVAGGTAGSIIPGAGTAVGSIIGAIVGAIGGTAIGGRVGSAIASKIGEAVPDFSWPDIGGMWPGWPNLGELWPGWPDIGGMWPGWPNLGKLWPGWPNLKGLWPGWPDVQVEWTGWPDLGMPDWPSASDILGRFPSLSVSSLRSAILGGGDGGDGDSGGNGGDGGNGGGGDGLIGGDQWWDPTENFQRGGVVRGKTTATVGESGPEVVQPLSEFERMIDRVTQANQDGGGDVDMSSVEGKLDDVNRNIKRLSRAIDGMELQTDRETIGRIASDGQTNRVSDTDPMA